MAPPKPPKRPARRSVPLTPPLDETNEVLPQEGATYPQILRGPHASRLRSGAGVVFGLVLFYLLSASLVSQVVVALGYSVSGRRESWAEYYRQAFAFERPVGMLGVNLGLATLIPIAWAMLAVLHRVRPRWLSSVQPRLRWRYLLLCGPVAVVSLLGVQVVPGVVTGTTAFHPQHGFWGFLVVILVSSPLQAAAEEVFFRGYLLQALGSLAARPWVGIVGSSVVFALLHGSQNLPLFVDRLAFGLLAALLVWRTGGLEAGIAAHVVNNIFAFVIAGLTSSIATLKAVQSLSWLDASLDVGSFALFAVLAYLTFRALRLRHTVELVASRPGGLGGGRSLQ
ncbi:lysostaphin resistance A-like protein [uncultured Friedmanniella sp.]|uniref:CPBP family intramembrane glutamic endopeptidase n=1 Tax=uncultured Friedmanniella sp. TaxID=335381 RepID=UPI0035CA3FB5